MLKISDPLKWEELIQVLDYDIDTGIFTWKEDRKGRAAKGTVAGSVNSIGYVNMSLGGKRYSAHRLAWFYVTKDWPDSNIDHIDRNKANNAFINLRDVSQSVNIHNADTSSRSSKSGFKNARKVGSKYQSEIKINGISKHLGMFDTAEAASLAAAQYRKQYEDTI